MEKYNNRTDLPVLLIYNSDPAWSQEDYQDALQETDCLIDALRQLGHPVLPVCIQNGELESAISGYNPDEYVVFNWCEELPGVPHSEYQAALILDRMGFTYTSADSQALILSQDKIRIKTLLQKANISTPAWRVYTNTEVDHWESFPAIVKPAFEHCGVGISRDSVCQSMAELTQRINYVITQLGEPAIVEDFIDGREFHIGVIGNEPPRMLPPAEIDYSQFEDIHDRLCTYEANFDKTSQAYQLTMPKLPVDLSRDELSRLEEIVIAAYQITACRDYARMDVRLRNGVFYLLDVNHNADFSSENSLVQAAGLVGLSYGQLGSYMITLAAERHPILR